MRFSTRIFVTPSMLLVGSYGFQPELALLLAESFVIPSTPGGLTPVYARYLAHQGTTPNVINASQSLAEPIDCADRLSHLLAITGLKGTGFDGSMQTLNSTCMDPTLWESTYNVSSNLAVAITQSAILSYILATRSQACGYLSTYLVAYMQRHLYAFIENLDPFDAVAEPEDHVQCYIDRTYLAAARLEQDEDAHSRGFLTLDACDPDLDVTGLTEETLGGSGSTAILPGGFAVISYLESDYSSPSAAKAWLPAAPAVINQARVWFQVHGMAHLGAKPIDLFTIQGKYTLRLAREGPVYRLSLSIGCRVLSRVSLPLFKLIPDWNLAGLAIADGVVTVTLDDETWQVRITSDVDSCEGPSATLGPRVSFESDRSGGRDVSVNFYGFQVWATVEPRSVFPARNLLTGLGVGEPVRCLTKGGFEFYETLVICTPSRVVPTRLPASAPVGSQSVSLGYWIMLICLVIFAVAVFWIFKGGLTQRDRAPSVVSTQAFAADSIV